MTVLLETWNIFSVETWSVFCLSEGTWSISSWETWNLSSLGTFLWQGISCAVLNNFSKEISNGIFWAKLNIS